MSKLNPIHKTDVRDLIAHDEARKIFGVSVQTFWKWRRGLVPSVKDMPKPLKIGNKLFFRKSELNAWLEKRKTA
jgi:predicted DNA-binding transcriptional regulator AlpA